MTTSTQSAAAATAAAAFTLHTSFSPLLPLYHTFLLDQFGVLHNGSQSLHGVVPCIQHMVSITAKKKLAILSNTSSPSHVALTRLPKYGLNENMFVGGLVSSGEECAKFVRETYCNNNDGGEKIRNNYKKALWFTWEESETQNPLEFLSHCSRSSGDDEQGNGNGMNSIHVASSVEEADFILLHGSQVWRRFGERQTSDQETMIQDLNFLHNQDYTIVDPILEQAAQRNLPMVCANPDLVVGLPGGLVGHMPGKIAERYQQMGGSVLQFGKPNPRHFLACLDNLKIPYDTQQQQHQQQQQQSIPGVAHVGDSLEHDVVGANAAGIDSIFVLGGIHAEELGLVPTGSSEGVGIVVVDNDDDVSLGSDGVDGGGDVVVLNVGEGKQSIVSRKVLTEKLELFFEQKGIWPTHVIPSLSLDHFDTDLSQP